MRSVAITAAVPNIEAEVSKTKINSRGEIGITDELTDGGWTETRKNNSESPSFE